LNSHSASFLPLPELTWRCIWFNAGITRLLKVITYCSFWIGIELEFNLIWYMTVFSSVVENTSLGRVSKLYQTKSSNSSLTTQLGNKTYHWTILCLPPSLVSVNVRFCKELPSSAMLKLVESAAWKIHLCFLLQSFHAV
jgi:hypothetical protein